MRYLPGWLYRDERGTVVILVAILLIVLLGMGALVIDAGALFESRRKLVTIADSAAIAGADEMANQILFVYSGTPSEELPEDIKAAIVQAAEAKAIEYAMSNGAKSSEVDVSAVWSGKKVTVDIARDNSLSFARVLGWNSAVTGAHAIAITGPIHTLGDGAVPIFVPDGTYSAGEPLVIHYKDLKGGDPPMPGNYYALDLGEQGGGAKDYLNDLKGGYADTIVTGQTIPTETGNMPNPTENGIQYRLDACRIGVAEDKSVTPPLPARLPCIHPNGVDCTWDKHASECPREVMIVVCSWITYPKGPGEPSGKTVLTVEGFLPFFIDGIAMDGTLTPPSQTTIVGHVISEVEPGKVIGDDGSPGNDYGAWAVNLIQ